MKPSFQKIKLKNGITLIFEKRDLPVVSVSISNPFGASHEPSKIKGIAHFMEHLVFTGTKTRTHEDISREIESKGGIINAFTSEDVTSFLFKLPAEHIFKGLDILVDILKNPTFNEEKFEKEKKVILEEIKMYHDNPRQHIYDKLQENLYKEPFGLGVIGSQKTVSALKREFVYKYFKEKYSPENYIVTIVGNTDIKKIANYLEKNFSKENKRSKAIKVQKKNGHSVEKRPGLDQAHFMFGIHAPEANDKKRFALEVLNTYLAGGMSSRLFLEIREKRGLAYNIAGSINTEKNYSYYSIYVGTTKQAIPEVKRLILEEFNKIKDITEEQIEEAKERLIGLRKISKEESMHVMTDLLLREIATGKAEDYYNYEKNIKNVSIKDVRELAKIKNYSTAAIIPK